jgi:hypothetical protein
VLIEQKIIIRWQNFQIKFTIPTDQLVKLTNMCCYCLHHLKIQNGHQRRSKFALKPYGKLGLNYIKDCQSILEEVVSADRTKNNNKMAKLSN